MTGSSTLARARRAALATLAVATSLGTLLPGGVASAAPSPADLVVGLATDPTEVGPAGDIVRLDVSVRNAGGAEAADTTVKITLPDNATMGYGELATGWTCDADALKCKYGDLAANVAAPTLYLYVTLPAGEHDQKATITATAGTQSHESSTANNTGTTAVRYVVQPDLNFEFRPELTEISYLGGMGARAFIQAVSTNVGTVAAPDVTFRFTPPAGARMDPAEAELYGWKCDASSPTWVCTGPGGVEVGQSEYLNLSVYFPAGTVGDTLTMAGSVSTTATERSLTNNGGETAFRYVVPRPADIVVAWVSVVPNYQVKANEQFDVYVEMDNIGGSPAENVKVRVPLAPTVQMASLDPEFPGWTCAVVDETADRAVECAREGAYDISQPYNRLRLRMTAGPGTPDGPLTFTATASTTSTEETTENNTAQGSTVYVAEGIMTGHAWIDTDRDGQRDADEPGAYGKIGRIEFVLEGTRPSWDVPTASLNENGIYSTRLKPGRYVANVYLQDGVPYSFTTPDVGDDATDSDIVGSTGGYYNRGWSAVVEVKDAEQTFVDIGLVPTV
ncbi:hypothetical protein GA0070624_1133 [Micromonospora rhizosphaerae]|uniref:Uncharacterized protein n=1 Tax=Micromonospora rhizosphaerae TaxID=568872 RepID=A0A1C6RI57_9ACTN|nr:DUF11 domain-containing protein [Micromonospora rhizosphaerae]SCL16818.1 hypothetical protein GA0070624_1133 [Micromonospora rhizosphaerae]